MPRLLAAADSWVSFPLLPLSGIPLYFPALPSFPFITRTRDPAISNSTDASFSFNSSGATIVPDNRRSSFTEHTSRSERPNGSGSSLMPHDTLGMELEDALQGETHTPMDVESQEQWELVSLGNLPSFDIPSSSKSCFSRHQG